MEEPALPLMRDFRRITNPPCMERVDHSVNTKYGGGSVVRSIDHPIRNGDGDDTYSRRNQRLGGDPQKRAMRLASEELRILLYRRKPQDPQDPYLSLSDGEVAFDGPPYKYCAIAETGDHAPAMNYAPLAIG